MRSVDQYSIDHLGVTGQQLMSNAAERISEILRSCYCLGPTDVVAIVCGGGNNGGDGFLVGKILQQAGINVQVYLVATSAGRTFEAQWAQRQLEDEQVEVMRRCPRVEELTAVTVVVDALLGTGFRGPLKEPIAAAIAVINAAHRRVLAVDIPSGLSSDSLRLPDIYVRAERTVALGFLKHAQVLEPSKSAMGKIELADIGFPPRAIECLGQPARLLAAGSVPLELLSRTSNSHKGSYGHVLVLGGSPGMYGAPILAAQAALYAGAGLVSAFIVAKGDELLPSIMPEIMVERIVDNRGYFCSEHLATVLDWMGRRKPQVIVLGMGMGAAPETQQFIRQLLQATDLPVVVDADGLRVLATTPELSLGKDLILTPHAGEFRSYLNSGQFLAEVDRPLQYLREMAGQLGAAIVHKSATTIIAGGEGELFINSSGNPGMASAGMGDTLAGIIGAFWAQGISRSTAASMAVFLHGVAGNLVAREWGELGVRATKVAEYIGRALISCLPGGGK